MVDPLTPATPLACYSPLPLAPYLLHPLSCYAPYSAAPPSTWHAPPQARRPLSYLGTRSELENEILRVRVFDWDLLSVDDIIGKADVPLSGLLEYGQVDIELTHEEEDMSAPKVRGVRPRKIVPAGRLVGQPVQNGLHPV